MPPIQVLSQIRHELRPTSPEHIISLRNAGGFSGSQFWTWPTPQGTVGLRRWPAEHPSFEQLTFIHRVLRECSIRLAVVPAPIPFRDEATFVSHAGHLWELTNWLPGRADFQDRPTVIRAEAAMHILAQFHLAAQSVQATLSPNHIPEVCHHTALDRRRKELVEWQQAGFDRIRQAIRGFNRSDRWLADLAPLAEAIVLDASTCPPLVTINAGQLASVAFGVQPVIRDIWHDHVLFIGDEISGIVDFVRWVSITSAPM